MEQIHALRTGPMQLLYGRQLVLHTHQLLPGHTRQQQTHLMVVAADAGGNDLHNIFSGEELIIRVIDPTDTLGGLSLIQIIQSQDHRLLPGLFADIVKDHGNGQGVIALGHHAHHGHAAHLHLGESGLGQGRGLQSGLPVPPRFPNRASPGAGAAYLH